MGVTGDGRLRILRIARAVYPESMGGGAIHVDSMSKRQAAMGHDVTVLTTDRGDRSLPTREEREGYTVRRVREVGSLFGNSLAPGFVTALRRLLSGADVVHVHSHLSLLANVSALFTRYSDTPMILTNHGLRSQTAPDWLHRIYLPTVGRFTFNAADTVLCYSETERYELQDLGVRVPIEIIHNGIDATRFSPSDDERKQQLLFVGRLRESKGPQLLLEAFERLAGDFPELEVTFVGDGPLRDDLEQRRETSSFGSRITLLGEVANHDMPRIYAESTVFVLPTKREGVPRTVLESMACGTPVVTTDLPQVEQVVGDGGRTVVREVDAFERVIREVLADRELAHQMGEIGRQRVAERYSWDETVERTTAMYSHLLSE